MIRYALAIAMYTSMPALAHAQNVQPSRYGVSILSKEIVITQLAPAQPAAAKDSAVRPFRINVPEADLVDLRRRIAATRWPERETVADRSQGVQLARIQPLVHYWGTGYDWRRAEAKLNALPQFMTTIDGLDIHFIHVRSRHPNALPVIITHGWPGSVFEQLKVIAPLTDPTAHGGRAEDAFDVVIPSMPGYGCSGDLRPGCRDGLPRRDLPCAKELGRACLSQAHLLPRGG
jgi:hypothetical protein